jgi:hypothetical protein
MPVNCGFTSAHALHPFGVRLSFLNVGKIWKFTCTIAPCDRAVFYGSNYPPCRQVYVKGTKLLRFIPGEYFSVCPVGRPGFSQTGAGSGEKRNSWRASPTIFSPLCGRNYIRAAMLKGEMVNRWTEMITVHWCERARRQLQGKRNTRDLCAIDSGSFRSAYPDSFAARGFGSTKFRRSGRLCCAGTLRHRGGRQACRSCADCRCERLGRLLHAAMRRTHASAPDSPPSTMASWTGCAGCSRSAAVRSSRARPPPTRAAPSKASHRSALLITHKPRGQRRNRPPWCAIGIPA